MILYMVTDSHGSFEDFPEDVSFNLEEEFGLAAGTIHWTAFGQSFNVSSAVKSQI